MNNPKQHSRIILVVDDDDANRYVVARILQQVGFTVQEAATGSTALDLASDQPDLVILDIKLPDINGLEVCQRLKLDPKTALIPVLHLSAQRVGSYDKVQGLESGADGYLTHPVDPLELIATVRSLLRIREAERKLQQSEQRFRAIFNQTFQFIGLLEPDGLVMELNQTALDFAGLELAEVTGRFLWELKFWQRSPEAQQQLKSAVTQAVSGTFVRYETEVQGHDNQIAILDFSIKPVQDDAGNVVLLIPEGRDITDRKTSEAERQQAEQALLRSESRFQRLVESNIIGSIISNFSGSLIDANDAFLRLIGYSRAELQAGALDWKQLTPAEFLPSDERAIAEARQTGSCLPYEKEYYHKDGSRIAVMIGFALLEDNSEQVVSFVLDLTERKKQEQERERLLERERAARSEAEAANRIKDEFLATLSHELRSPLNAILGWAQLMRSQSLEPTVIDRALETIERNARHQTQLIEDLLDVSRIIRGKLQLHIAPVNVTLPLLAAIETMRLAADAKQIQLQLQIPEQFSARSPLMVLGDPSRLQQVFWNLLSNAIKFTPINGQITIQLEQITYSSEDSPDHALTGHDAGRTALEHTESSTTLNDQSLVTQAAPVSQPLPYAQITITDTGRGITPDFLPHVFEYFRQADGSITRTQGGLGLGLAIVRHLVEQHGGTAKAASPGDGQGATFTVLLPLIKPAAPEAAQESMVIEPQPSPAITPLQALHILVVDDEPDTRDFLALLLQEQGATVTTAASAQEGLQVLQQTKVNLLISDIGMPHQDGYMLMQQIRTQEQDAFTGESRSPMPAIALTAYAREEDIRKALAAGFQAHLAKPIASQDLIQAILNLPSLA
ncbi:MAG: response regulator [Oculatellaceae cyanobacterium Prado106]|nr:response regulator [Oculatellaceae cyanobacterium Prado106]